MARFMMNCEEYSKLVSENLDRSSTLFERLSIWYHQIVCPPCNLFRTQLETIRAACRAARAEGADADPEACRLPDEVRQRIKETIMTLPEKDKSRHP